MVQPVILLFYTFFVNLIYCNFGQIITNGFEEIYDTIEDCDWHLFPMEIQRNCLPIILINTQQSVVVQGFGNIDLSREMFKRVSILF